MTGIAPEVAEVDRLLGEVGDRPEHLIALLQGIQERFRYLPEPSLRHLAERIGVSPAEIEGVASFYSQFRRLPIGKHLIRVCHGTACHVKGADLIEDAVGRHLHLGADEHTDPAGQFTVERVACVGCCSIAPVLVVDEATYGHLRSDTAGAAIEAFQQRATRAPRQTRRKAPESLNGPELRIATDSCCAACGSLEVRDALQSAVLGYGLQGSVRTVSCTGLCHLMPMVEVGERRYTRVRPEDAEAIARRHLRPAGIGSWLRGWGSDLLDRVAEPEPPRPAALVDPRDPMLCAFLGPQRHLAMEHSGDLSPLDLDAYEAKGGLDALQRVLKDANPEAVIQSVLDSGLRGRGGAGFPTGRKWDIVRRAAGSPKYLICNGDEGDPGAFMDRMLLESFPYRVLEGMAIAAFAMGIEEGVLYIRAEYPQAVASIRAALLNLEERGVLAGGDSGRDSQAGVPVLRGDERAGQLRLRVVQGAGAFVCGEETALIASIEGKRGTPRIKPPFPAESGLWGKPTCVNNVETYALLPWIVRNGAEAFAAIGTEKSKGTKVFALTGAVKRGGLIEVPMGTPIRQIVEEIGGGVAEGRTFKAVLVGGPAGGCVPASLGDTPVDYEALQSVGAIMGSGGLVVLDDSSCMVDVARYFMRFTQTESCGKCTLCRLGTRRMLDILDRLCTGAGQQGDLEQLEELGEAVAQGSICGLGLAAPNPVLTTLRHFRDEYEAHLEGRCPAGKCTALIHYRVEEGCIGCTKCAQICPVDAIAMRPLEVHEIDDELCVKCDACLPACPEGVITVG